MTQTNLDRNMNDIFGISEVTDIIEPKSADVVLTSEYLAIESDFNKSKSNLENLLIQGQNALNSAISVAAQTDDHKAYSTISSLLKTIADINEKLVDLHLKLQKHKYSGGIKPGESNNLNLDSHGSTTNIIFAGSTSELSKIIRQTMNQSLDNGEIDVTTPQ